MYPKHLNNLDVSPGSSLISVQVERKIEYGAANPGALLHYDHLAVNATQYLPGFTLTLEVLTGI